MIPQDLKEREKVCERVVKRYQWSKDYFKPWREKWVRYYKIWRSLHEAVSDLEESEEPNTFVPYVFGMIEDLVSKVTEPLFKLKPPCRPRPRKLGDGKAADNFATMVRSYFSGSEYQLDYGASCKEEFITGNAWEQDTYAQEWEEGLELARSPAHGMMDSVKTLLGKAVKLGRPVPFQYQDMIERPKLYPERVGYHTEFPQVWDMHPEPGVKKVRLMNWLIHEEPWVSIEALQKKKERGPDGELVPIYDFTELLAKAGKHEPGSIKPRDPYPDVDYRMLAEQAVTGVRSFDGASTGSMSLNDGLSAPDGIDRVHLLHEWTRKSVVTIATCNQGKFVVRVKEHPFHVPRIPFRLRVYTQDKQFLYGLGAIEPIEDEVYELNDTHNLAMANWIRIINKMVAVDMSRLVDPDDLNPKAGGRIRISEGNVHEAIAAIDHSDVSASMITQESNIKGIIEKASGSADLAPGVLGTKQAHDTATGALEIQRNMAMRASVIRRIHLANYQEQMWMMEKILSQFQFDPIPYTAYGPDGSTMLVELTNESIYTEGRGFDFVIEEDPSFGDDFVQRQQWLGLFDMALKYEQWRMTIGGPKAETIDMAAIFRRIASSHGFADTTNVLKRPDDTIDPAQEFDMILSGGSVEPNPKEDLIGHLIEHLIQRQSPVFLQGMTTGKIPREAVMEMDAHIAKTMDLIKAIMRDPQSMAQMRLQETMMSRPQIGMNGGVNAAVA